MATMVSRSCVVPYLYIFYHVSWIERGHHVEGKEKETASLHSSMPILIEQKKNPSVSEATTEAIWQKS